LSAELPLAESEQLLLEADTLNVSFEPEVIDDALCAKVSIYSSARLVKEDSGVCPRSRAHLAKAWNGHRKGVMEHALPSRQKLSHSFSGALRTFSYWVANGTLGHPLLEGIDYSELFSSEPSALEQTYAIFANVIEMDDKGTVLNAKHAEQRAAQWLRSYCDPNYKVNPPFEDWEVSLH